MDAALQKTLPNELLDLIVGNLDHFDLASWLQCSRIVHGRVEPVLYAREDARKQTMRHACRNGNEDAISLAASYGASISDDFGTFKLLLDLGARVDDPEVNPRQLKTLMKYMCKPGRLDQLQLFLEAGPGEQVLSRWPDGLSTVLISAIQSGASVGILQLLLDAGGDPDYVRRGTTSAVMSPLSAAIMANSASTFRFLLEKGADIQGTDLRHPSKMALHIPMFAAIHMLSRTGPVMVQLCLESKASLARRTAVALSKRDAVAIRGSEEKLLRSGYVVGTFMWRNTVEYYYVSPPVAYLESLGPWWHNANVPPVCGLARLLDYGPIVEGPGLETNVVQAGFDRSQPLGSIGLLLQKWLTVPGSKGPGSFLRNVLTRDVCAMMQLLVEHGADPPDPTRVLSLYNNGTGIDVALCTDILTLLFEDSVSEAVEKSRDHVLWLHVTYTGRNAHEFEDYPIIEHLIGLGADINARREGWPSLQVLCLDMSTEHNEGKGVCSSACSFGGTVKGREESYFRFFRYLIGKGADPLAKMDGSTAIDILRWTLRNGVGAYACEHYKDFIWRLAGILEDTQRLVQYDV